MVYLIGLSILFGFAFALAGILYPDNRRLLVPLCALSFVTGGILAWRQYKNSPPSLQEIRRAVREEVSDISQPPQLKRLKRIAQQRGISVDNILNQLEGGTNFDKGLRALLLHQYDEAIDFFGKNSKRNRKQEADSLFYTGNAFMLKTDYVRAAECYRKAIGLNPQDPWNFLNYGAALEALKQYADAAESIKKAIALDPKSHIAYNNLGNVQHKLKNIKPAIEDYEHAIKLRPDFGIAWMNLGNVYMDIQEYQIAAKKYKRAAELMPEFAPTYNSWAVSLCKSGKYEESLDKFKKAVTLAPNFEMAWFNWFFALDHLGRKAEAKEKLRKSAEAGRMLRENRN